MIVSYLFLNFLRIFDKMFLKKLADLDFEVPYSQNSMRMKLYKNQDAKLKRFLQFINIIFKICL